MAFTDYELYVSCLYQHSSKAQVFQMHGAFLRRPLKASF